MKSYLITFGIIFGAIVAMAEPPGGVKPLPTAPRSDLYTGLYYVTKDTTIKSDMAKTSGLYVSPNTTAAIYIPKGVTLTVQGGDGNGANGGGAGIRVPKGSTLVVTGGGTLKAIGGKAGNGQNGDGGSDAWITWNIENHLFHSGTGGYGGAGGGGAGAGIGGYGGTGGAGGAGGTEVMDFWENDFILSGNGGNPGSVSWNVGDCGTVIFMGNLTVDPQSGAAGEKGTGAHGSKWVWISGGNNYGAWGGGGGGGGGAGAKPFFSIGCGGVGGSGGGGGGSGCLTWIYSDANFVAHNGWGWGGTGGKGGIMEVDGKVSSASAGTDGTSYLGESCSKISDSDGGGKNGPTSGTFGKDDGEIYYRDDSRGGSSGAGGGLFEITEELTNTSVSISSKVRVNNLGDKYIARRDLTTHDAIKYTVKFSDPDGLLVSRPGDVTVYLGMNSYPEIKPSTTKNIGLVLDGWYTAATGGTKVYDGIGKPLLSSYEHYEGDLTLYPQTKKAESVPCGVYVNGLEVGKPGVTLPAGCVYEEGIVHINGNGPYTLSGANVLGQVAFRVEGANEVSLVLDGLTLRNERAGFGGLIDIASSTNVTISVTAGKTTTLEASGDSVAAIHCPTGTSVRIVGKRSDGDRKIKVYNDWTVADAPFALGCDYGLKGSTVDLSLRSGPGAATIGGIKGEPCGNIALENCDLNCIPNGGTKADRVHEIGDGLLGAKDNLTLGGHVDIVGIVGMLCPLRSGTSDVNALTIARPRPHDVYGVPLMPAWWGDWIIFVRPGVLEWATSTTIVIPRSGQSVR